MLLAHGAVEGVWVFVLRGGEKQVMYFLWQPPSLELAPCPLTEQELLVATAFSQSRCPEESGLGMCLVRWVCA